MKKKRKKEKITSYSSLDANQKKNHEFLIIDNI